MQSIHSMRLSVLTVVAGLFVAGHSMAAPMETVYTFDHLDSDGAELAGQDNWQPFSNHDNDAGEQLELIDSIGQTIVRKPEGSVFSESFHLRPNDESFSIPTFSGNETEAYIQFSVRSQNHTGGLPTRFGLASDPGDGSTAEQSRDHSRVGPTIFRQRADIGFRAAANGDQHVAVSDLGDVDMAEIRLVMDFTANDGDGSGSLYYRNAGWSWTASGDWIAMESLQDIPLGLLDMNEEARDPATWNAMFAGAAYPARAGMTNLTVFVPEPGTLGLLGCGGLLMLARRRR